MKVDRPGDPVEVEWVDSVGLHGWHEPAESVKPLDEIACRSVGYLLADDERGVVILQSVQASQSNGNSMAIPRSAITAMKRLK